MSLVKLVIPYIVKPLKHIFNNSLQKGVFPDSMKIARVIPIFKTGGVQEFSNYRPISILPQFSKILEKIFHSRLTSFLNDKQLLDEGQYGFRKKHSTSMAIFELVEEITTAMDNSMSTVAVFIDLKEAFDTATLVIFYINDFVRASDMFDFICYADDTTRFSTLNKFANAQNINPDTIINIELANINEWLEINKLSLNVTKTKFMVFHTQQNIELLNHLHLK